MSTLPPFSRLSAYNPPVTNTTATNPYLPATKPLTTNTTAINPHLPATNPPATNTTTTNPHLPATNPLTTNTTAINPHLPATNPPATNTTATNPPATDATTTNPPANNTNLPSVIKIDRDYQNFLIAGCANEIFALRGPRPGPDAKPEDIQKEFDDRHKKIIATMKKYETIVYEKYIQKIPVSKVERKNEKQDLINSSIKYPFAGEASFLTDYHRLLRGYEDEANFNPQKVPYDVTMPKDMNSIKPEVPFKGERVNYIDTQANSKFYFPQDYQPHYDKKNFYTNKPSSDISNQQHLFVSQHEGMFDPHSSHAMGFGNTIGVQGFRSQAGLAVSTQNLQFPGMPEDDTKLRKTIESIGGITRTVPNMERSLYDNEIRNIEKNYRYNNQLDITSNKRLNTLLQNPMTQVYSPHFDAPNARDASPQRGDIPNLQKPGLYYSPEKNRDSLPWRQPSVQPQVPQLHPDQVPFMVPTRDTRDGLAERNLNSAYNPTFSSSKNLREEMMGLLHPRHDTTPENIPQRPY